MRWRTLLVAALPVATLLFLGSVGVVGAESVPSARPDEVAHPPGANHPATPKRLEAVIEIDMDEFGFVTPDGQRNPTFIIPVGQTVGIHLHNEGKVVHELAIGSGTKMENGIAAGYDTSLFTALETDVFFYSGDAKAELEGALFEEMEIDPGIKDVWLRLQIPADRPELFGEWELGCFVPAHYEAGMHARLIVQ